MPNAYIHTKYQSVAAYWSKTTLNYLMMVERYPNLKEEAGGLTPGCEISSLLDRKTCQVAEANFFLRICTHTIPISNDLCPPIACKCTPMSTHAIQIAPMYSKIV
jgi:hypothetical protein